MRPDEDSLQEALIPGGGAEDVGGASGASSSEKNRTLMELFINSVPVMGFWVSCVAGPYLTLRSKWALDEWSRYLTDYYAAPEVGGCSDPMTFSDYLQGHSTRIVCSVQPMKSSVIQGVASVYSEMAAVYLPALGIIGGGLLVTAALVPLIATLYHRYRYTDEQARQHSLNAWVKKTDVWAHEYWGALRPAAFAVKELWTPLVLISGMASQLFSEATNNMASATSLSQATGAGGWVQPTWQSLGQIIGSWRQLESATAVSFFTPVERVASDDTADLVMSAPFSTAVSLTAGSIPAWMLVFTGSLLAFNVAMAYGSLDLFSRWHKGEEEITGKHPGVRRRRALFCLSDALDELSEPKDKWSRSMAVMRAFANSAMFITLVSQVVPTAWQVGNVMAKEFFPEGPDFGGLIKDNWLNHEVAYGVAGHLLKDDRAVVMSMAAATQTNIGYQSYAIGNAVMLGLTLTYLLGKGIQHWRASHAPLLPTVVTEASAASSSERWERRLDTLLKADQWVGALTSVLLVGLVGLATVMFREHLEGSVGDVCPVDMGYSLLSDGVDAVYPGFENCTAVIRGEGVLEGLSWSWPLVALGGATVRALASVILWGALVKVVCGRDSTPVPADNESSPSKAVAVAVAPCR